MKQSLRALLRIIVTVTVVCGLPCALNAADETAVAAFLAGRIAFPGIARVVQRVLEKTRTAPMGSIAEVLAADGDARRMAEGFVAAEGARRRKN